MHNTAHIWKNNIKYNIVYATKNKQHIFILEKKTIKSLKEHIKTNVQIE